MGLREATATLLISSTAGLVSCAGEPVEVEQLVPRIVAVHPFDASSFTQGLELEEGGTLLVGTGEYGESRIYRTTLEGQELASAGLEPERFGEGITRHGGHIWQLTWRGQVAVKRDADTLEEIDRVPYPGEGWGLCSTGEELIMSDGTDTLRRLDPGTFAELDRFQVTADGLPQENLNELECVDGDIYANVFLTTDILRIDADGTVTAVIDAAGLPNNAEPAADHVLNGIAHVPGTDRFLVGGKRWPDLYEVELIPAQ
ncbi:glutaminyl-peptide cyclotransferase [Corynebacterium hylobatis]|uniref:Glutaminyl-peptide cyclotransferase n=1 Tax=Corynebacterium hylobatis TaxID=1859290 RepID=A0A430HV64_9CORY|nr:glutaminyl-peptide cyclotransferase [Corynebacterium hylobatis]RSZ61479.1 glutaminyl-peptide cyclotransferase [Corynebacterium hylobatis]